MKTPPNPSSSRIAEIITSRTASDPSDLIEGWQKLLTSLLSQMTPYLREGHLVTFRTLTDPERKFFEKLHRRIAVPPSASAIYISPSVRFEMTYRRPASEMQPADYRSAENQPDQGILLAGRQDEFEPIVNALFAKPPFTPAIDVYENGRLLAGYAYHSIDECIADLTHVLQTHLQRQTNQG